VGCIFFFCFVFFKFSFLASVAIRFWEERQQRGVWGIIDRDPIYWGWYFYQTRIAHVDRIWPPSEPKAYQKILKKLENVNSTFVGSLYYFLTLHPLSTQDNLHSITRVLLEITGIYFGSAIILKEYVFILFSLGFFFLSSHFVIRGYPKKVDQVSVNRVESVDEGYNKLMVLLEDYDEYDQVPFSIPTLFFFLFWKIEHIACDN